MGAEHFRDLNGEREAAGHGVGVVRLEGAHLSLTDWQLAADAPSSVNLGDYAESFVVPLAGEMRIGADGVTLTLRPGELAYVPVAAGLRAEHDGGCHFVTVGWPCGADRRVGDGEIRPYVFAEALRPEAAGWRFFSVDGAYMTVGCSYREALPPAREQPHSHDGEQLNLALEGRFAFTVGGHTQELTRGWAALTPRGVEHTGLHLELPYFQLIFATPPRGQDYAEFLRGIYRPRAGETE